MGEPKRRLTLNIALALWGLGTWLGVNGVYVQLPLLVERLPEGWALPASMVLAVQLGNTGLLLYALVRHFAGRAADVPSIYGLLAIGTTALVLNAFLYDRTVLIGGTERSFVFLILTFCVALVGCTSSIVFYPYLRNFRDAYLPIYLVGEGMSGLVTSLLALTQGVGGEPVCLPSADDPTILEPIFPPPNFEITPFFLILGALTAISLLSFITINNYKGFDSERLELLEEEVEKAKPRESLWQRRWVGVMALMVVLSAFSNGVLPSIQTYSCLPYGRRAYQLSVTLGALANPAACLAGALLPPAPDRALAAMLAAIAVPFAYMLATALMSPAPPLMFLPIGEAIIVISWVVVQGIVSYGRMWVYGWARRGGARGMRLCGAVGQVGSASGSAMFFFLVNYTALFTQIGDCALHAQQLLAPKLI